MVLASSGREALSLLATGQYDVVASDYEMPGMNGIELLHRIRDDKVPVGFILFTERDREDMEIETFNAGADFYLQKRGDSSSLFTELFYKCLQVHARLQAERAARESRQQFLVILNFLPDPTYAIDQTGTIIAWNHGIEQMTGISASVMIRRSGKTDSIPFSSFSSSMMIYQALRSGLTAEEDERRLLIGERSFQNPEGQKLILWAKVTPLFDLKGRCVSAVETMHDITERKRIIEERRQTRWMLEQKNRMLAATNRRLSLLSNVTNHDIKNQLTLLLAENEHARELNVDPEVCDTLVHQEQAARKIEEHLKFAQRYQAIGDGETCWQ